MLTLAEEIRLLAIGQKRLPGYSLEFAQAGAVLCDLALLDRIDSDLDTIMVVSDEPTGNDVLDSVLQALAASDERRPRPWLLHLARVKSLGDRTLARLVEQGILSSVKRFPLGIGAPRHELVQPESREGIRSRLREVLTTDVIPDPRDVVLVCLAHACSLLETIASPSDLATVKPRIDLLLRMDLIGQKMLKELVEIRAFIGNVGWWGVGEVDLEPGPQAQGG